MKTIDTRTSGVRASVSKKGKASSPRSLQVILTEAERELLIKACKKYRYTIPGYIRSKQPEVRVVDAIIHKLS
ncbi:MAG: hypothetical protein GTO12_20775 [Proteobacteria bacterium]|nr:hypothetical protein [Pseudomonadota bacterium]